LGAIGAAAGGANTGTGLAIAAGAALAGAAIGAAIGHHQDQVCHQLALQKALDQAMLANAAWQQNAAGSRGSASRNGNQTTATAGSRKPASRPKGTPAPQPEYQTVAWANKQSNASGAITPVTTLADTSSDQVCMLFNDQQTSNGQTHVVPGKACRGPDGEWKPV
jgi:surface antigen